MGMLDQVKQAMQMRKEAKRFKRRSRKITSNTPTAASPAWRAGNLRFVSIKVSQEALKEVIAGKPERF
jgi:hypothetical protein